MSDYRPFTDATRQALREWAENTILRSPLQSEKDRAWDCLRYEGSLQTKDATIAALVMGILDIPEWMSGRSSHICPLCKGLIGEHKKTCLRNLPIIQAAIKEVPHAR